MKIVRWKVDKQDRLKIIIFLCLTFLSSETRYFLLAFSTGASSLCFRLSLMKTKITERGMNVISDHNTKNNHQKPTNNDRATSLVTTCEMLRFGGNDSVSLTAVLSCAVCSFLSRVVRPLPFVTSFLSCAKRSLRSLKSFVLNVRLMFNVYDRETGRS